MPGAVTRQINTGLKAEQQEVCLKRRIEGATLRTIASEMGVSVGTVENRIKDAIAERVTPPTEELVRIEVERYDYYLDVLRCRIAEGDKDALNIAMKVADRRARLLGLDMPTRVEATVTEITQMDLEAQELLREANARTILAEKALEEA